MPRPLPRRLRKRRTTSMVSFLFLFLFLYCLFFLFFFFSFLGVSGVVFLESVAWNFFHWVFFPVPLSFFFFQDLNTR